MYNFDGESMKWSELLTKPTRIFGLLVGMGLVASSIFSPLSGHIGDLIPILKSHVFDLVLENTGWITIVYALREKFWGISRQDLPKFIPLVIMYFVTVFVYSISRQHKDVLVIPEIGAEGAVACKLLVLVFVTAYQFFYNKFTRKTSISNWVFFASSPIVIYFVIFAFFLIGNTSVCPSAEHLAGWKHSFPFLDRMKIFDILRIWPRVVYYIFCEMYAVTVMMIWIWQVINRYVSKSERIKFISSLLIAAQIASLNTGLLNSGLGKLAPSLSSLSQYINIIILILTLVMFLANRYLAKNVPLPEADTPKKEIKTDKSIDIFTVIRKHPVYVLAALLTVYYGLATVWAEQFWKDKMRILAGIKAVKTGVSIGIAYNNLNSFYFIFQSRMAIFFALVIANIANKLPWLFSATITPLVLLFGSIAMFGSVIFPAVSGFCGGLSPIDISYWGGFFVIATFKGFKYNFFDRSKEDYVSSKSIEDRREIKNLEGLLGRVGKSGAAVALYVVIVLTGSSFSSTLIAKFLFFSCIGIAIIWIISDWFLNKDLHKDKH